MSITGAGAGEKNLLPQPTRPAPPQDLARLTLSKGAALEAEAALMERRMDTERMRADFERSAARWDPEVAHGCSSCCVQLRQRHGYDRQAQVAMTERLALIDEALKALEKITLEETQ